MRRVDRNLISPVPKNRPMTEAERVERAKTTLEAREHAKHVREDVLTKLVNHDMTIEDLCLASVADSRDGLYVSRLTLIRICRAFTGWDRATAAQNMAKRGLSDRDSVATIRRSVRIREAFTDIVTNPSQFDPPPGKPKPPKPRPRRSRRLRNVSFGERKPVASYHHPPAWGWPWKFKIGELADIAGINIGPLLGTNQKPRPQQVGRPTNTPVMNGELSDADMAMLFGGDEEESDGADEGGLDEDDMRELFGDTGSDDGGRQDTNGGLSEDDMKELFGE